MPLQTLPEAYDLITNAVCAEDVFGDLRDPVLDRPSEERLQQEYEKLETLVNPDNYTMSPDEQEMAQEAFDRLSQFLSKAQERLAAQAYGYRRSEGIARRGRPSFSTELREYFWGPKVVEGDWADIYKGESLIGDDFAGQVAIKVVRDPADNDLARTEIRILKALHAQNGVQRKHLPVLLDQFKTKTGQLGIILRYLEKCFDFPSIRGLNKYRDGVPPKHMVWMLNRSLSAIGYAHSLGILHRNITPEHLMIYHPPHNLFILDWGYASENSYDNPQTFIAHSELFSPPEVLEKRPALPSSDLYSLGMCMIYILGGDLEEKTMPDSVEGELQRFIKYMILESPLQRAQDAWQLHHELNALVIRLWGPKKFLPFELA